jgi:hypothetical protein
MPARTRRPPEEWLEELLELFPEDRPLFAGLEPAAPAAIPEPYRSLLVHDEHMTVTLEEFHATDLLLDVLAVRSSGSDYSRKLRLRAARSGRVVLAGILRFDFRHAEPEVRRKILEARIPLGRILIEHDVHRRVQSIAFFKIGLEHGLGALFETAPARRGAGGGALSTYGRLAMIFCNGEPAVELLEIVAPEIPKE